MDFYQPEKISTDFMVTTRRGQPRGAPLRPRTSPFARSADDDSLGITGVIGFAEMKLQRALSTIMMIPDRES